MSWKKKGREKRRKKPLSPCKNLKHIATLSGSLNNGGKKERMINYISGLPKLLRWRMHFDQTNSAHMKL
jgi:hypothetical protein